MSKQQSKYASVGAARAQMSANYPRPGHYWIRIDAVEEGKNFKKEDFIANRYTVIRVLDDSIPGFDFGRKAEMPTNSVGESVSDVMKVNNVAFEGRVKAFAMVSCDVTEAGFQSEEYPGQIIDELVSADSPAVGAVIDLKVEQVIKQNAQNKEEDQITNSDTYTKNGYVRRVPFAEVLEAIGDDVRRFVPDIDAEIEAETADA